MRSFLFLLLFTVTIPATAQKKKKKKKKEETTSYSVQPKVLGVVQTGMIAEASGIAASKNLRGCYWTHNDSGNKPEVYLLDSTAQLLSVITLSGTVNRDWEDVAEGAGPIPGKQYVYVGNIGNNAALNTDVQVFRFQAPARIPGHQVAVRPDVLNLRYPDGAKDAESLMIDPIGKSMYIVSKREKQVGIYKVPQLNFRNNERVTMQKVGTLPYSWITAADISQDGLHIAVKNKDNIYYWHRKPGESIETAMARPAVSLPYVPEKQGEGLTFKTDNSGYITISEGKHPALNFYPHKF